MTFVIWCRADEQEGQTMTTASTTKTRRNTLNLRIPPAERNLIDCAAESAGKTRTDFILEAARRAAEEALLDRAPDGGQPRGLR